MHLTFRALLAVALIASFVFCHAGHSHEHEHGHSHDHIHEHETEELGSSEWNPDVEVKTPSTGHTHSAGASHTHAHRSSDLNSENDAAWITNIPGGIFTVSFIATAIIGVAPVLMLEVIPLIKTEKDKTVIDQSLLKTMLGFAVGGLLGDVFLHLLPHATNPHSHDGESGHHHSHVHGEGEHDHSKDIWIGIYILCGMMAFFLLEKYMRISRGGDSHGHSHSHAHDAGTKKEKKEGNPKKEKKKKVDPSAYLNIIADSAHNFTDGMAIAASFLISPKVGLSTTVAVFFHEIPHEIGDYAILIQSGFSKSSAMYVQLVTAIGALMGTGFGLISGGIFESSITSFILPFTAGGFIYIATVDVIPNLMEGSNWKQTMKELAAICVGIGMMVIIALYE